MPEKIIACIGCGFLQPSYNAIDNPLPFLILIALIEFILIRTWRAIKW